jgi:uncharacterized Zn finger protein (UPF0148 family)
MSDKRCPECGGVFPRLFGGQHCPHCDQYVRGRTRDVEQSGLQAFSIGGETDG